MNWTAEHERGIQELIDLAERVMEPYLRGARVLEDEPELERARR